MGRGQKRGRTQRKHFKEARENVWKYDNTKSARQDDALADKSNPIADASAESNPTWQPFATKNQNFEDYYKEQCIVSVEEWDTFMEMLRKPLPSTFRINSSGQFYQDIKEQLENDFVKSLGDEIKNSDEVEAIRPLPWYPGNLAWHTSFSRMQLRKNQTLERFHEFLKQENEIGNITRQEAVSMVPPLFLNVSPEHHVLDMCAAPGSKTFQLLEMMHESAGSGSLPSGLVLANDVDVQRCNLLIHQTKRMSTANLIVTNHEAQHFPGCQLSSSNSTDRPEEPNNCRLLFDRVLCDVPCSGDGTLRKAPDIWRKWHSGMGNGLHVLQVQIAMRGLSLLKVGGRMVYSTCSMNPVENEAVVSEILSRSGSAIVLLDVSGEVPQLVRRPGLKKWKVRDKGIWLSSYTDVPLNRKSTILPSMFPCGRATALESVSSMDDIVVELVEKSEPNPSAEATNSGGEEEISSFPLERCMRILPHDQNGGAFFIAVFQKISPLKDSGKPRSHNRHTITEKYGVANGNNTTERGSENLANKEKNMVGNICGQDVSEINSEDQLNGENNSVPNGHSGTSNSLPSNEKNGDEGDASDVNEGGNIEKPIEGKLQIQGKWKGIDPVVFFSDEVAIDSIKAFYGLNPTFPLHGHLISRNEDASHVKRIYYISKSVHDILQLNLQAGNRLKIASLGLKLFERQTSKDMTSQCAFRISSEGLPLLLPYISNQIVHAALVDFQHLLQYRNIKFADFVDAEFAEKASNLLSGCCVVVLKKEKEPSDGTHVNELPIAIVCWKGRTNLSIMVTEMDSRELRERIALRYGVAKGLPSKNRDEDVTMGSNIAVESTVVES